MKRILSISVSTLLGGGRCHLIMVRGGLLFLLSFLFLLPLRTSGQEYHCTSGLLQVPSAEMDSAGTFRGNFSFLHRSVMPSQMPDKSTYSYGVGISFFRWLQASYCATMLWMHKVGYPDAPMGFYNEDRRVNVKAALLYEGSWWPAIAVGIDDIGRLERLKNDKRGNNYFQNLYAVGTKHFLVHDNEVGVHLAYRYYPSFMNRKHRGIAGGLSLRPACFRSLRAVAEWDGLGVNVGADVLLWRHLFLQASLSHGCGFSGGVSYQYRIKF